MFRKKSTDEGSNFWISYADLMAGLLFVFILLIGAIVSKSIILKTDLHEKEERLAKVSKTLQNRELTLDELSETLLKSQVLLNEKDKSLALNKADIENKKQLLATKDEDLKENKKSLNLKKEEIKKLYQMLLDANTQKDMLSNKVIVVQNLLTENNNTLQQERTALKKTLKAYKGEVIVLSNQLTSVGNTVKNKDEKLLKLLNALDEKETKYDALIEKLQGQKAKIKSLTGIKLKVVAALKEELGSKIDIDKRSGSLKLASNILFDKGSSILKEESKTELKRSFEEYIGALVTNSKIKPHLERVIIEGHTDSDGGYLYNLNLSQKRAFEVMNFLLTLDFAKAHNIQPLLIASGRAYLDVVTVDGIEDKEASRRIEIKFRLKNEDAMHEIEKVLDAE
ncbi:MAG: OmpA family protein [Campylobacterota bacterium]|nr:OmpA family protein [Campylobacterota bacterium]